MKKNQIIRNNSTGEPRRPSPPLHYHLDFIETFTVKQGKLDIYIGRDQKPLLLQPGESVTAQIRRPHRFANDHDEPVIFTIKTKPAGGAVRAFQLTYGIANEGEAARDGRGSYLSRSPSATCQVSHEHFRESLSVVSL